MFRISVTVSLITEQQHGLIDSILLFGDSTENLLYHWDMSFTRGFTENLKKCCLNPPRPWLPPLTLSSCGL